MVFSISSAYDCLRRKHKALTEFPLEEAFRTIYSTQTLLLLGISVKIRVPTGNHLKKYGIGMVSCYALCDAYCFEEDAFYVFH